MKQILSFVSLMVLALLAVSFHAGWVAGQESDNRLPECKYEDSRHCYWDADTRGNGLGNDVVNR